MSRNTELHSFEIESTGKALYEYGVLLIKNLLLLNGGALVALPAIATVLSEEVKQNVAGSAALFVTGLSLAMICGYFTHLNWLFQHSAYLELKNRRARKIGLICLGPELQNAAEVETDMAEKLPFERAIKWTFWVPHVTGIASLISLVLGCWLLLGVTK
ncbi:MAG: hypothetical protein CVT82_03290 [Alphaproteobacteria bacterium HGW-Alphaproteobacteria-4]|nr:MAG: hypothetical protein CVT82_03290 [Alphaproteobacteria bacterium HGW-Alphaproteobacteria-4]